MSELKIAAAVPDRAIKGVQCLLSEAEVIEVLGLGARRNPGGALRSIIRRHGLRAVRPARGILCFEPAEVRRYIDAHRGLDADG